MKNKYYVIIGVIALLLTCNSISAYPTISGLTNGEGWRMVSLCNDSTVPKNCDTTHYFQGLEYTDEPESLDQYQNLTDYDYNIYGVRWTAQSFTPNKETVTKVKVWIKKVGTPTGQLTCRICVSKYDIPDLDNCFGYSNISSSTLSTTYGWVEFDFTNFTHPEENELAIVLNLTGGSINHYVMWSFRAGNPYVPNDMAYSSNSGDTWTVPANFDFAFQTYGYNLTSTEHNYSWNDAVTKNILNNTLVWWNYSIPAYENVSNFIGCRGYWIYIYDVNYTFMCNVSDIDKSMDANDTVNLSLDLDSWVNLTWYSWFNDSVIDTLETILQINSQYINTTVIVDDSFSGIFYFNYTGFEIGYNSSHNYYWNDTNNTFWVISEHLNFTVTKEVLPFFLSGIVFSGCLFYFIDSNKKKKQKKKESYME